MKYPEVSNWFTKALIRLQNESGSRISITQFGDLIDQTQPTTSAYFNGTRKPSYKTALFISKALDDYSLLDILGYARPEPKPVPFSSLPPEFLDLLKSIDGEIRNTLRERAITEYSPEAELVASEILEKYGARLISTTKSGKSSKQ